MDTAAVKQIGSVMLKQLHHLKKYTHNASYYDDIVVLKQRDEQELETKENVAYGTTEIL